MYEEQRLVAAGLPLEDAVTLRHTARREGVIDEFMREMDKLPVHRCTCGGAHKCPDCPNRK